MTASIRVFICYKKMLLPPRPGKRKSLIQRENVQARLLHDYLKDAPTQRYLPWIDDVKLGAGVEWETKIYKSILESDVLVVVVGPGTSESPWVQREIALANTLGISVVPIGTGLTREEMTHELKELGIKHLQGKVTQNLEIRKGAPKA